MRMEDESRQKLSPEELKRAITIPEVQESFGKTQEELNFFAQMLGWHMLKAYRAGTEPNPAYEPEEWSKALVELEMRRNALTRKNEETTELPGFASGWEDGFNDALYMFMMGMNDAAKPPRPRDGRRAYGMLINPQWDEERKKYIYPEDEVLREYFAYFEGNLLGWTAKEFTTDMNIGGVKKLTGSLGLVTSCELDENDNFMFRTESGDRVFNLKTVEGAGFAGEKRVVVDIQGAENGYGFPDKYMGYIFEDLREETV